MLQAHRVLCTVTTDALICRNSEGGKGVFAVTMPGRHALIESPASRRGANSQARFRRTER
jgi:hypothetical protein